MQEAEERHQSIYSLTPLYFTLSVLLTEYQELKSQANELNQKTTISLKELSHIRKKLRDVNQLMADKVNGRFEKLNSSLGDLAAKKRTELEHFFDLSKELRDMLQRDLICHERKVLLFLFQILF